MTGRIDNADIRAVVAAVDLAEIARAFVPDLKRKGREWVGCCPFHGERTPSFTVWKSNGRQYFKCFGCGESGDAIGFTMRAHGLDFHAALRTLADDAGISDDPVLRARAAEMAHRRAVEAARRDARDRDRRMASAAGVWRATRPAAGTIAEIYLAARGIPLDLIGGVPPTIRFLGAYYHREAGRELPAMVAAVQGPERNIRAVHLTYLAGDGRAKADVSPAKRMIGPAWGGAVRFGPAAPVLYVAEGIETALSVLASLPTDPRSGTRGVLPTSAAAGPGDFSVWAALSLGNIAGSGVGKGVRRQPDDPRYRDDRERIARLPSETPDPTRPGLILPAEVRDIVICADGDGKDPPAGRAQIARAAARWRGEGRRVRVAWPPAGCDFNDLLTGPA